jgi:hypothetical protein
MYIHKVTPSHSAVLALSLVRATSEQVPVPLLSASSVMGRHVLLVGLNLAYFATTVWRS